MKQLYKLLIVICLFLSQSINSQNIQYDLRCSSDGTSYEIYVSRDITTAPFLAAGSSTITLVLPTGSSRTVAHTSESVATYSQVTAIIDGNGTGNDYYPFNSSGGANITSILTANTPVLWLTLTPSDGTNQNARLFINGTDPSDIGGVNPSNVFTTLAPPPTGTSNEYSGNVSDTPVNCSTLSTDEDFDKIANISLYPNPVNNTLHLEGNITDLKQIEIFNLIGQRVMQINTISNTIDVSHLEAATYLVKLTTHKTSKSIKLIKQ